MCARHSYILYTRGRGFLPLLVERSRVRAGEEILRGKAASPLIPTFSPREKGSDGDSPLLEEPLLHIHVLAAFVHPVHRRSRLLPLLVERSRVRAGEEILRGKAASPLIPTFSPREKGSDGDSLLLEEPLLHIHVRAAFVHPVHQRSRLPTSPCGEVARSCG